MDYQHIYNAYWVSFLFIIIIVITCFAFGIDFRFKLDHSQIVIGILSGQRKDIQRFIERYVQEHTLDLAESNGTFGYQFVGSI